MRRFVLLLLVCCALGPLAAQTIHPDRHYLWLETEQFEDLGGWYTDTQFIDQMGSSFLLARSLTGPVADATTTVNLPAAGTWRLWARCRDWLPTVKPAPGRFTVRLGAAESPVLGDHDADEWRFAPAGEYRLPAGPLKVALHDLVGEYGRVDMLFLTDDPAFTPPADFTGYVALREKLTGVVVNFEDAGEWDVVVVGGGLAGSFAAISAARAGARTLLIQDRTMLGGNASDEIGVRPEGATANAAPYAREGGLPEEGWRGAMAADGSWSKSLANLVEREPNLTVMMQQRMVGVDKVGERIVAVRNRHVLTGAGTRVRGKLFIDCTGDATLGYLAGNEYHWGSEPRSMYGESLAPEVGDEQTMGNSIYYRCGPTNQPVAFTPPAWAYHFADLKSLPYRVPSLARMGYWWIEWGGEHNTIDDAEMIRDTLLRITYGLWDFLKNRSGYKETARNWALTWVGVVPGKRENRRLIGDYVLTEQDVRGATLFEDRVAFGGWTIDHHPPAGFFSPEPPSRHIAVPLYSIPFRCLYAKDVPNLLMAGRNISVSRVALGTTRVMLTCGTQGQAVGTAAALCLKHGCTPRELAARHIGELQDALQRADAHILDRPLLEPDNLARDATITASSYIAAVPYTIENIQPGEKHDCSSHDRAVRLPSPGPRLESARLLLENAGTAPLELKLGLRIGRPEAATPPRETLAEATATLPPGQHWVTFPFARDVPAEAGLWFVLPATRGLSWSLTASGPAGSGRAYGSPGDGSWTARAECYAALTEPTSSSIAGSEPRAVADGWTRPRGGNYHGWIADATKPLPQWIEFAWDGPRTIRQVDLVFDVDFASRRPEKLVERQVIRDYTIEVRIDGQWRLVHRETDNVHRQRRHVLPELRADGLRVTALTTGGDPAARLYEVRIYPTVKP